MRLLLLNKMPFMKYQIAPNTYYVGVNDRHKHLFENMLALPNGVSYNSYLLVEEKSALIDCVESTFTEQHIANVRSVLGDRTLDYVIVNHVEPDHSSGLMFLLSQYPDVKIVTSAKAVPMLQGYYKFNNDCFIVVKEGDTLSLGGGRELAFYAAPMVHWPEVIVTYDAQNKILFSADAFGCFGTLDGAVMDTQLELDKYYHEMYRYYANIVGKYGAPVQAALKKLGGLDIAMVCSTHGPVWTEHFPEVMAIYDRLSRYEGEEGVVIVAGSMYGNTELMAESLAQGAASVTKKVILHDISKSSMCQIIADVFRYKGLVMGAPTYCNDIFPPMAELMKKLELRGLKNREYAAFGSCTWADATAKIYKAFAEKMSWELAEENIVSVKHAMNDDEHQTLFELGRRIAEKSVSK